MKSFDRSGRAISISIPEDQFALRALESGEALCFRGASGIEIEAQAGALIRFSESGDLLILHSRSEAREAQEALSEAGISCSIEQI